MLYLNHKKLPAWKLSLELVIQIYSLTEQFPESEKFGLVSQLRRATVSIISNISEGASRSSLKERIHFYEIARSSLVEVETQLIISQKLGFITIEAMESKTSNIIESLFVLLTTMMKRQRK